MFEIRFVNRFHPERGEQPFRIYDPEREEWLSKVYETLEEAEEACYHANEYTTWHGCYYWIEELA